MKKLIVLLLAAILLCSLSTEAFARGGHYRYRGGRYYRSAWWGLGGFITGLAVGAYVTSLPPRYETVVIGGVPYYYYDGYYYQAGPGGYVIVAPPVVQGQTVTQEQPNALAGNGLVYILGTLVVVLLLAGFALLLKKLFSK